MTTPDPTCPSEGVPMELEMPFVTVASVGGPHDDESYVAGYECGRMDALLSLASRMGWPQASFTATVATANLRQLDLIAMRHGYRVESVQDPDVPQWASVRFELTGAEAGS